MKVRIHFNDMKQNTRGGRRNPPGGRPKKGDIEKGVPFSMRLRAGYREQIEARIAAGKSSSMSAFINEAIAEKLSRESIE